VNGFVGLAFVAVLLLPVVVMMEKKVTSTRRGSLALAAAFLVGVVIFGAVGVGTLEAIARLRGHGLTANATITNVDEVLVSFPGHVGWETTVTVSFTDTSGGLVRAQYTDNALAGGKKAGQTIQIVYDPANSTSISPVGHDPRSGRVLILGLAAVAFLGFSVYFVYRAWRRSALMTIES
jgi:hypothetical protein